MGKNTETNLNGSRKPEELEHGSANSDYSATRVKLHLGPILTQQSPMVSGNGPIITKYTVSFNVALCFNSADLTFTLTAIGLVHDYIHKLDDLCPQTYVVHQSICGALTSCLYSSIVGVSTRVSAASPLLHYLCFHMPVLLLTPHWFQYLVL